MIILDVFPDFSSVESEFCIEEKFGIKLALPIWKKEGTKTLNRDTI